MKPLVTEAFMLAIIASEGPPAFPGLPGHARACHQSAARLLTHQPSHGRVGETAPDRGAYVAESNYFQADWQKAYWGPNSLTVKQRYDSNGLFFVRHGVGSEGWSEDGFTRLAGR